MDFICIIDREGKINCCFDEFSKCTGLRIDDNIFDQIDKTTNTGEAFITHLRNIDQYGTRSFDIYPITQPMITPDGWRYDLYVKDYLGRVGIHLIIPRSQMSERLEYINDLVLKRQQYLSAPVKVLLVDDSIVVCKTIKRLLENAKHECDFEVNPLNVVEMISSQYNIIMIDINMPGMNGLELCNIVRDIKSLPLTTLLVAISSTDEAILKQQHISDGDFDYFIQKPVDGVALEHLIDLYKKRTVKALGWMK